MKGLLVAEWIKATKRKLPWVLGLISLALSGLSTTFTLVLADLLEGAEEVIVPAPTKPEAYVTALQSAAGNTWVPIVLTTVIVAGEYAKGTWPVALTWNSSRVRHLTAKFLVMTAISAVIILLTAILTLSITAVLARGDGFLGIDEIGVIVAKVLLVQVAWVAISMLGSVLFRSAALAVGLTLGFSLTEQILGLVPVYRRVSLNNAVTGLFGQFDFQGIFPIYVPDPPIAAAILGGWTAFAVALTLTIGTTRDA